MFRGGKVLFAKFSVFRCEEVYKISRRSTMLLHTRTLFWPSTSRDEISIRIETSIVVVYRENFLSLKSRRIRLKAIHRVLCQNEKKYFIPIIIGEFYRVIRKLF